MVQSGTRGAPPRDARGSSGNRLGLFVLVGMILGVLVGLALRSAGAPPPLADALAIPGDVFIGGIKMVVVPLVLIAVTLGIAGNDNLDVVRRIGFSIVVYFLMTTAVAVSIGSGLALLLEPGAQIDPAYRDHVMATAEAVPFDSVELSLRQQIKGLLPTGLFFDLTHANMLQIVVLAAFFGASILVLKERQDGIGEQARASIATLEFCQEVIMTIVGWALKLAPLGVMGMMANVTMQVGIDALISVAAYSGVVLLALVAIVLFYAAVLLGLARRSALEFFKAVRELQLMAFSTSSSAAVMPLSIRTAELKLNVSPGVSRFIVPLGATVNMDGTAAYQAVAAIFLMQVFGVETSLIAVLSILGTAILASIGTPGTPGVGIVVLAGILESNGVPGSGIALIFGVDRLLDMCRTVVNVTGDQTACVVMERFLGRRLEAPASGAGG